MTINDIIALANAGFNAQQIAQFAQVPQIAQFAQVPQVQQAQPGQQVQMVQPGQQAQMAQPGQQAQMVQPRQQVQMVQPGQQVQMVQPGYDPFTMIMNKLGGIQQTMQTGNIMGMNMTPQQENTDTILASIINPPQKGDGK